MIKACEHFLKPVIFSKTKLQKILEKNHIVGISDADLVSIMMIALELHLRSTSESTIHRSSLLDKINLTKKAYTTPYAINYAIEKHFSLKH